MRTRDNQRSRVYRWEAAVTSARLREPTWRTIDEVLPFAKQVWLAERARYGRGRQDVPSIESSHWGQRRPLAKFYERRITLPLWARNEWMVLHELAHLLIRTDDEPHGPRFVAVLMGMAARHLEYDVERMLDLASEYGVNVHTNSIGAVPERTLSHKLARLLPVTTIEAAVELDVSYRQVQGASLALVRSGLARWFRGKLINADIPLALSGSRAVDTQLSAGATKQRVRGMR